jgi:hypothetical protein
MVFIFDGYANLPTGRTDALNLQLRCYGNTPFKAALALPYRNAKHARGFAIHNPKLIECSAPRETANLFAQAFYAGIDSYKSNRFGFSWNRYLDQSV